MRELNKNYVYSLEDLTSEEFVILNKHLKKNKEAKWTSMTLNNLKEERLYYLYWSHFAGWCLDDITNLEYNEITNAKELFYTLENIQVDCRCLKRDHIKEMAKISGYKKGNLECYHHYNYFRIAYDTCNVGVYEESKTTITYEKFMELFGEITTDSTQPHYDNTNGSIYKFCNDQKLNAWEFDIIKRVVRCRKKGLFKEDLQKTKDLIDLYLKEFTDEK